MTFGYNFLEAKRRKTLMMCKVCKVNLNAICFHRVCRLRTEQPIQQIQNQLKYHPFACEAHKKRLSIDKLESALFYSGHGNELIQYEEMEQKKLWEKYDEVENKKT